MSFISMNMCISLSLCSYILLSLHITFDALAHGSATMRLSSGYNIPIMGFGTHELDKEEILENLLTTALENGLRHINTAFIYKNEKIIGKVLKKWFDNGGKREDIFITSKLPYFDNHPSSVEKYIKLSLEKLGLEYVDMYLIHAPFGVKHVGGSYEIAKKEDGSVILDTESDLVSVWKAMEEQVETKRARSIGLSNFNETQIIKILKHAKIKPSNLEVEIHAYHQQKNLHKFCNQHGIILTGYAPLGSPGARQILQPEQTEQEFRDLLKSPLVIDIANRHGKSTAQILLRHVVQNGAVVIPSSKKLDHLTSNLDIFHFELTEKEMEMMNKLDKGERGKIFDYKHILKGVEAHPEYPWCNDLK